MKNFTVKFDKVPFYGVWTEFYKKVIEIGVLMKGLEWCGVVEIGLGWR
jgi:hypothetical protein